MRDLSKIDLTIRGIPIATLEEVGTYAYAVPESLSPPAVMTRFTAGQDVDPRELYEELEGEGRTAAGDSDAALEILEVLKARLRAAFPDETFAG